MVEYDGGEFFPQFDFKTGKENLYKDVKLDKIKKIGWYPFTVELKSKVPEAIYNPFLPYYEVNVYKEDKLIIRRRGFIEITGKKQRHYFKYILGTQDYIMIIDERGNVEVQKELD